MFVLEVGGILSQFSCCCLSFALSDFHIRSFLSLQKAKKGSQEATFVVRFGCGGSTGCSGMETLEGGSGKTGQLTLPQGLGFVVPQGLGSVVVQGTQGLEDG